jgi:hypothetical protein
MSNTYNVESKVWIYPGKAAWHFVNIPNNISEEIDFLYSNSKKGWGSLPVEVTFGDTTWNTSIFPDKKTKTYLLPLKADVRKKESIVDGDTINFVLKIKAQI